MIEFWVLALIICAQLISLVLTLYWFRGTPWRNIWLAAIVVSIVVGALRRSVLLAVTLQERVAPQPGTLQDLIVLAILTMLLFFGVVAFHLMLRSLEQTTASLRHSESHFRGMVENLPGVVYRRLSDASWTPLYISSTIKSITGYPAEEFVKNKKRFFISLIHPDDQPVLGEVRARLSAREPYDIRYRFRHASGATIWLRDCGRGVYDEAGTLLYLTGFIADATERMHADKLVQAQHDLSLALNHALPSEHILELCLAVALEISGMDAGGIYLVDRDGSGMRLACHKGFPEWLIQKTGFYPKESKNAQLVQAGECVYRREGDSFKTEGQTVRAGLKAFAIVPVRHEGSSIACIKVASYTLEVIPDLTKTGLENLASQMGQIIARERAQAVQREREESLAVLFTSIPDMLFVLSKEGRILRVNPAVANTLGYGEEDLIDQPLDTLVNKTEAIGEGSRLDDMYAGERTIAEFIFRANDGRKVPVETSVVPGVWTGEPAFFAVARDITERVQSKNLMLAQRDLALSFSHAATLDETLSLCLRTAMTVTDMDVGGIYLVDENSGALQLVCHAGLSDRFVNEASYYPGDRFNARLVQKGSPVYTHYGSKELEVDTLGMREGLKALAIVPVVYDNRVIACINVASRSKEEVPEFARNSLESLAGQAGQIILRNREQIMRREREANLSTLFFSVRDMLFVLDEAYRIVRVNPAVLNALGYGERELLGEGLWEMNLVQDVSQARQLADEILAGKRDTCELRLITRDERKVPVETSIVAGKWDGNAAFFIVARDITERIHGEEMRLSLERQVQVARRLESLGILAGGVAHDFNNLLTVIMGNAEMVQNLLDQEHPGRKRLDLILQTSTHASGLCRHMLTFAGRSPIAAETFYLHQLLQELEPLLKTMVSEYATLHMDVPDDLPPMKGDPTQLRQVVMNLLMNASDAIGEQPGTITVSLHRQTCSETDWKDIHLRPDSESDDYLVITVTDTGCGMDEETSKRIFDPFFSTKFAGRGMGMAAVLGILSAHHGGVSVESEPGKGSTFRLFFAVQTADAAVAESERAVPQPSLEGITGGALLFVDDEEALHDVGRDAGKDEGFEVLTASNGIEAVEQYLLYGDTIRLVVLDLTMPLMNGTETFQELRRIDPDVRVLVASGYSTADFEQQFAGGNLVGVLQKPYSTTELRNAIRRVVSPTAAAGEQAGT